MRKIKLAVYVVCVAILLWIAVSFVNIVSRNTEKGHVLPAWNFFNILMPETETEMETDRETEKGGQYVLHS